MLTGYLLMCLPSTGENGSPNLMLSPGQHSDQQSLLVVVECLRETLVVMTASGYLSKAASLTSDLKCEQSRPYGNWCVQLVGFRAEKELGCLQDWESQCEGLSMKCPKGSCVEGLTSNANTVIGRLYRKA